MWPPLLSTGLTGWACWSPPESFTLPIAQLSDQDLPPAWGQVMATSLLLQTPHVPQTWHQVVSSADHFMQLLGVAWSSAWAGGWYSPQSGGPAMPAQALGSWRM